MGNDLMASATCVTRRMWRAAISAALAVVVLGGAGSAKAAYWNVFNQEADRTLQTAIVTYATRSDMLSDTNRLETVIPSGGGSFDLNIIDSGSNGSTYWNLFNQEGDRSLQTAFATYATLTDMLGDTNRTGVFIPSGGGSFDLNIVGAGFDGHTYWNLFNQEGDRSLQTAFVTYATLNDMLTDTNRIDTVIPSGGGSFDLNIVGSGSDGLVYWNLFNQEDDRTLQTAYVTYATLDDMLHDTHRLAVSLPSGGGSFDLNIVGTGTDSFPSASGAPEPATWALLIGGMSLVGAAMRRRRGAAQGGVTAR